MEFIGLAKDSLWRDKNKITRRQLAEADIVLERLRNYESLIVLIFWGKRRYFWCIHTVAAPRFRVFKVQYELCTK